MTADLSSIPIIDTDTHVVEPPDLWTSRVAAKFGDRVPQVRWDEARQEEVWVLGDKSLGAVAGAAMAGWHEHPPFHPRTWAEADPQTWDADRRLGMMDGYGIHSQLLYPNVAVFNAKSIVALNDKELQLACVQAYNDYLIDWAGPDRDRLVAMACLPFWDLELDPRRDRAGRCQGPQGAGVHPGPERVRAAHAHRPLLGPDVGIGPGEGPPDQLPHRIRRGRPQRVRSSRTTGHTPTTR